MDPSARDQRSAVAVPQHGTAVLVTMRRGRRGPWTVLTDDTAADGDLAGPPPGYLVLAGIASCTVVTVAGVASRRGPELRDIVVSFDVSRRAGGDVTIEQRTSLQGEVSETDHERLSRTARHCPVGKLFTKRAITIEDRVDLQREVRSTPIAATAPDGPRFLDGTVSARWLPETREWALDNGRRVLAEEGEVRIHADGEYGGRRLRWGLLGGHTAAGWAPRPSSYAAGGLASSTLMTLRARSDALGIDPTTLRVEVRALSDIPSGGKRGSQDRASEGEAPSVRWLRHVTVEGSGSATIEAILEAMRLDPIYGYCMRGDLISSDTVVASSAPARSGEAVA